MHAPLRLLIFVSSITAVTLACGQIATVDGQHTNDDGTQDDDGRASSSGRSRGDGGRGGSSGAPRDDDDGVQDDDDDNDFVERECRNPPDPVFAWECDPVRQDCGNGEACMGFVQYPQAVCDAEFYGSYCVPEGIGRQGDPCGGDSGCAAGFWCLITGAGTVCLQTCDLSAIDSCDDGYACVRTDVQGVGACN